MRDLCGKQVFPHAANASERGVSDLLFYSGPFWCESDLPLKNAADDSDVDRVVV
jgi:hypothetical protein